MRFGAITTSTESRSTLTASTTQTGNAAATETDLFTISVPANTLDANGDMLYLVVCGSLGAGASADKRIRVYFGASNIYDSGNLNFTTTDWLVDGFLIRSGAATQKSGCRLIVGNVTADTTRSSAAETLSGAVTFRVTGSGTNANDVVGEFWKVEV